MLISFLYLLFLSFIHCSVAYRARIVFVCSYEENDWSGCGVESRGEWEVSAGETATAATGPQTGGAKNSLNFAFMDSNNNPPSARVSMTVKMPYECHHETELYAYMYGADVQYLEVDGLNHINTQWESYYILHRTGPFKTPTYEMPLDQRKENEESVFPGYTVWHKIFIRWNLYSQFKITAVNTPRNDSRLADVAVDEILVRRVWCKETFIDPDADVDIAEPTVGPEVTTIAIGEVFRLDLDDVDPRSQGTFGTAVNGAGDNRWVLGNAQTLFQQSSEQHQTYLLAASAGAADYSFADLILPDVTNGQCLLYSYRIYGTPVMALYVLRQAPDGSVRVMSRHQAADTSGITDSWAMVALNLLLNTGERVVFRGVKTATDASNVANAQGGSVQIDNIIVYEQTCDQTVEGARAIPKASLDEEFSLTSVQQGGGPAASTSSDNNNKILMGVLIPLGVIVMVGLIFGIILAARKKPENQYDPNAPYDPNYEQQAPLDPNAPYDPNYDPNQPPQQA